mgnify:CR=1 FL=1
MEIVGSWQQLKNNNAYLERYFSYLELDEETANRSEKEVQQTPCKIEFRDVSFRYPDSKDFVLKHLTRRSIRRKKSQLSEKTEAEKAAEAKRLAEEKAERERKAAEEAARKRVSGAFGKGAQMTGNKGTAASGNGNRR